MEICFICAKPCTIRLSEPGTRVQLPRPISRNTTSVSRMHQIQSARAMGQLFYGGDSAFMVISPASGAVARMAACSFHAAVPLRALAALRNCEFCTISSVLSLIALDQSAPSRIRESRIHAFQWLINAGDLTRNEF
jgi:hypothetical protein